MSWSYKNGPNGKSLSQLANRFVSPQLDIESLALPVEAPLSKKRSPIRLPYCPRESNWYAVLRLP